MLIRLQYEYFSDNCIFNFGECPYEIINGNGAPPLPGRTDGGGGGGGRYSSLTTTITTTITTTTIVPLSPLLYLA